jgi:hypothetical protein
MNGSREGAKNLRAWQYFSHVLLNFGDKDTLRPVRLHDLRQERIPLSLLPANDGLAQPFHRSWSIAGFVEMIRESDEEPATSFTGFEWMLSTDQFREFNAHLPPLEPSAHFEAHGDYMLAHPLVER